MARHPFLEADGPIAFAHRGGAGSFDENTMRAFHNAAALGFTHIETDVQATADGVALAFHDDTLDRATDGKGKISRLTWREVRSARVGGAERIVRLDELLEELPDIRLNLDPKSDAAVEPLVSAVRRAAAIERVCVCSFSDRRTRRVRAQLGASLCTGAGTLGVARLLAASWRLPAGPRLDFHAAQVPLRAKGLRILTPGFLAAARKRAIAVHVWTIDDANEMHRLLDLGVDGIMTDRPEVLRQVMISRGHWRA